MKRPMRNVLASVMCSASILGAGSAFGKAGDLDTTFGNGGLSVFSFASSGFVIPDAIQLQSDGKILVLLQVGNVGHGVLRFTTSGVPDTTFGSNGAAGLSPSFGASLALQPNGAADTSFANPTFHYIGTGGSGIEAVVNGLAVQSNGDIVVVGNQTMFAQSGTTIINGLARLTPSGNLDPAFGNGGTVVNSVPAGTEELFGAVIQANGNIITVGTVSVNGGFDNELTLARYLGN
jgi:uncharacterized delta-60 repeat protein